MTTRVLLGGALCLIVTGCSDSKYPLSDPQTSTADERLIGTWRRGNDYFHVGHAGKDFPKGVMQVVEVRHDARRGDVSPTWLMFPTTLGDKHYLNVAWPGGERWKPETVQSYVLLKYRVDGDKLVVLSTYAQAKARAIRGGKIKGLAPDWSSHPLFTDTTENVARFVVEADDTLWDTAKGAAIRVELQRVSTSPQAVKMPSAPLPPPRLLDTDLVVDKNGILLEVDAGAGKEVWERLRLARAADRKGVVVDSPSRKLGPQPTPTPPLRPLGHGLMVDKNGIIWDNGKPVGIWGVDGHSAVEVR
jgi:hypothetical protein